MKIHFTKPKSIKQVKKNPESFHVHYLEHTVLKSLQLMFLQFKLNSVQHISHLHWEERRRNTNLEWVSSKYHLTDACDHELFTHCRLSWNKGVLHDHLLICDLHDWSLWELLHQTNTQHLFKLAVLALQPNERMSRKIKKYTVFLSCTVLQTSNINILKKH